MNKRKRKRGWRRVIFNGFFFPKINLNGFEYRIIGRSLIDFLIIRIKGWVSPKRIIDYF